MFIIQCPYNVKDVTEQLPDLVQLRSRVHFKTNLNSVWGLECENEQPVPSSAETKNECDYNFSLPLSLLKCNVKYFQLITKLADV
jgi:hypothetical protein